MTLEYYIYMTNDCNLNCDYCSVLFDCKKNNIPLRPTYALADLMAFMERTQAEHPDEETRVLFFVVNLVWNTTQSASIFML